MVPSRMPTPKSQLLADRQMRRWEIQHPRERATPEMAPCVAISRLPGSGGTEIARRVAETLDYGFFGQEIVDLVAEEMGVDHWLVEGLDERVRDAIERMVAETFGQQRFSESDYLRGIVRAITTLGQRGSAVILGRGAAYILPPERALRVLLTSPRPARIERYGEVMGLAPQAAEGELARAEQRRADFALKRFGVRQDDPLLYDLVLNTAALGCEAAAAVTVEALKRRFASC